MEGVALLHAYVLAVPLRLRIVPLCGPRHLEPWVIGAPEVSLKVTKNPNPPAINCGDKR